MTDEISESDYVSPNWNNSGWWNDFYKKKLKTGEADSFIERNAWHLIRIIRKSLTSFFRSLKPGGALIESNFNLLDRLKTIEKMVVDAGFNKPDEWRFYDDKDFVEGLNVNRTEKYAVCF